ncbi:hypothetical protein BT69DRAFT_1331763 [Atractiella rhizophila]|nr:hypothetical protein BT69DRAFT_1331763 [Atractiella rhizophila]
MEHINGDGSNAADSTTDPTTSNAPTNLNTTTATSSTQAPARSISNGDVSDIAEDVPTKRTIKGLTIPQRELSASSSASTSTSTAARPSSVASGPIPGLSAIFPAPVPARSRPPSNGSETNAHRNSNGSVVSTPNGHRTPTTSTGAKQDSSLGIQSYPNVATGGIASYPAPASVQPSQDASSSEEETVPMVATRSRRTNAGTKMAALISKIGEMEEEEMFAEVAGDGDFAIKEGKEEGDEFDSDFGSTSESGEDEDEGEKGIREEEKEERRAKRAKNQFTPFVKTTKTKQQRLIRSVLKRSQSSATPAPDGDGTGTEDGEERPRKKQKVAFAAGGDVDDGEGTETLSGAAEWEDGRRTKSTRTAALKYINEVEARAEKEKERLEKIQERMNKSKATKQATKVKALTQADLIAQALEIEELNKASLVDFYAREDERRELERKKQKRTEVEGSRIVWRSFIDPAAESRRAAIEEVRGPRLKNLSTPAPTTAVGQSPKFGGSRNVIILRDFTGSKTQEMTAVFGDHSDWGAGAKPGPNRARVVPPVRKAAICAITGAPARYKDPLTGLPYSSIQSYKTIRALSQHQFAWSNDLNTYTGRYGEGLRDEVGPPAMNDAPPEYYISRTRTESQDGVVVGSTSRLDEGKKEKEDKSKKKKEGSKKRSRPRTSTVKEGGSAKRRKKNELGEEGKEGSQKPQIVEKQHPRTGVPPPAAPHQSSQSNGQESTIAIPPDPVNSDPSSPSVLAPAPKIPTVSQPATKAQVSSHHDRVDPPSSDLSNRPPPPAALVETVVPLVAPSSLTSATVAASSSGQSSGSQPTRRTANSSSAIDSDVQPSGSSLLMDVKTVLPETTVQTEVECVNSDIPDADSKPSVPPNLPRFLVPQNQFHT